jgi:RNA polymerase sigma factor (sigma-70 family)
MLCVDGRARLTHWFRNWFKSIGGWIEANPSIPSGEIDDLTQEVFLRLVLYCEDVSVANPHAYLRRVTSNVINDWHQRRSSHARHDDVWLKRLKADSRYEPQNSFASAQTRQRVLAALAQLRPRQRELLVLHVYEGLTYKQIAEARGLSHRIIVRDLARAYATLRHQFLRKEL